MQPNPISAHRFLRKVHHGSPRPRIVGHPQSRPPLKGHGCLTTTFDPAPPPGPTFDPFPLPCLPPEPYSPSSHAPSYTPACAPCMCVRACTPAYVCVCNPSLRAQCVSAWVHVCAHVYVRVAPPVRRVCQCVCVCMRVLLEVGSGQRVRNHFHRRRGRFSLGEGATFPQEQGRAFLYEQGKLFHRRKGSFSKKKGRFLHRRRGTLP